MRYRDATARDTSNAAPPDARIVSRAIVPLMPSFPKKLPIILLSTLATLMLTAGAVVARELLGSGAPRAFAPLPAPVPVQPSADPAMTRGFDQMLELGQGPDGVRPVCSSRRLPRRRSCPHRPIATGATISTTWSSASSA
jgi:hypothetical protein